MRLFQKICFPLALSLAVALFGIFSHLSVPASTQPDEAGIALPILMYHHILKETARLNAYTISPDEFRQDMQYLQDAGYTPILISDLLDYVYDGLPLPEKPVMITFDDGYESFYAYAFPILEEYGFPAVFSIVGTYADQYTLADDHHVRYSHCTWNQLALLQESGLVEIQNHSYDLHKTDQGRRGSSKKPGEDAAAYQEMLHSDLLKLQMECSEYLSGWVPTCYTYPFGFISEEALPVIRELGFSCALTCRERVNQITKDPEDLYHLGRFNRPHGKSAQTILEAAG